MAKGKEVADQNFENYEADAITRPYELAWENWMKFEKEGDKVQGYIRDVFFRKAEGEFKEQRGITLEQTNGELINVAVKRLPFILEKTDNLHIGDPLTIVFEKTLAPRQKGYKGAKQFGFYGKNLPENAENKTVAEMDAEDMKRVNSTVDAVVEENADGVDWDEKKPETTE